MSTYIASKATLSDATRYLSEQDPKLAKIIAATPDCSIKPHNNYYQELVRSIIGQQLSVKAARSILTKFLGLFDGKFPIPEQILAKSVQELKTAGLSSAKANYIRDLATHIENKELKLELLNTLSNDEIISELVKVKGIGEWTSHMFLMFAMGRLDVLAHGDLGIKNGVQKLYGFESLPTSLEVQEVALKNNWHPYESVACWYIWYSLDND